MPPSSFKFINQITYEKSFFLFPGAVILHNLPVG